MSQYFLKKRCVHCGREYPFNPSVGDYGKVCKKCGKNQSLPCVRTQSVKPFYKRKNGIC